MQTVVPNMINVLNGYNRYIINDSEHINMLHLLIHANKNEDVITSKCKK